jgi:YegS/Rv2252/BmrU family lipid kinase
MADLLKHIALICNPTSTNKRALEVCGKLSKLLHQKNIEHSIFITKWPENWNGISGAWIIGGDGTVNYFINQYPDCSIPLSVFAGGTGNDLHWMLYGKMGIINQVDLLLNANPKKIDAGICNGKLFLNGVGIGFDGSIVKDLTGKSKWPGKTSYFISIMKHLWGYKEQRGRVNADDEKMHGNYFLISVANGQRYGGGFHVAPKASLSDGLLDLNIVKEIAPVKRLRYLPVIEKGRHLELPFVVYRHVKDIGISFEAIQPAHIDGEYMEAKEFKIEILPKRFSFIY